MEKDLEKEKKMEGNREIKVITSFVANQYINCIFAPFFPL